MVLTNIAVLEHTHVLCLALIVTHAHALILHSCIAERLWQCESHHNLHRLYKSRQLDEGFNLGGLQWTSKIHLP